MKFPKYILLSGLLLVSTFSMGQKLLSHVINDFTEINPAAISTVKTFQINLKGFNYPELDRFYNGGYLKFIAPVSKINSTIGFHAQFFGIDDFMDFSDFKYGLSYSYSYNISEKAYLAIGAKASVYSYRAKFYEFSINYINYNEIDYKSDQLNIDAGIWYQSKNLGIGLSYNHINTPEHKIGIENSPYSFNPNPYLYEPEFNLMLDHILNFTEIFSMNNSMLMYDVTGINDLLELNINNILFINNTFFFGTSWRILSNDAAFISNYQVFGFNLKNVYGLYFSLKTYDNGDDKKYFIDTSNKFHSYFECSLVINL